MTEGDIHMRESLSEKKSRVSEKLFLICVANVRRDLQIPKETYQKNLLKPHEKHIQLQQRLTQTIG